LKNKKSAIQQGDEKIKDYTNTDYYHFYNLSTGLSMELHKTKLELAPHKTALIPACLLNWKMAIVAACPVP